MFRFLYLLATLAVAGPVASQQADPLAGLELLPRIVHYAESDYQAETQNWAITQSAQGILYVANSGGVLRFDGEGWTLHPLPGRPVVRSVAWHDDRLYAGGYGEFGYFPTTAQGLLGEYVSLADSSRPREDIDEIWNIELAEDGTVFFQTFTEFYRYAADTIASRNLGVVLYGHPVDSLFLLPVNEQGLVAVRPDLSYEPLTPPLPGGDLITDLTGDLDNLLLATTNRVFRYRAVGGLSGWSQEADRLLYQQQLNRIITLSDGTVAVGTIRNGLYLFTPEGALLQHLSYGKGLGDNTVLNLFEDRRGNLWVGLEQGLDVIVRGEPVLYYRQRQQPIGAVTAVASYGGALYVGTNQGLFYHPPGVDSFAALPGAAGQVWQLTPTERGLLVGHNFGSGVVDGNALSWRGRHSGAWSSIPVPGRPGYYLQGTYTGLHYLGLDDPADLITENNMPGLQAAVRSVTQTGAREVLALHAARGGYRVELTADWTGIAAVDTLRGPQLLRARAVEFGDSLLVQTQEACYHYTATGLAPLSSFRGVPYTAGAQFLPGRPGSGEWFVVGPDRVACYRGREQVAAYPISVRRPDPTVVALDGGGYAFGLEQGLAVYRGAQQTKAPPELLLSTDEQQQMVRFRYALPLLDRTVRYRHRLRGFEEEWSDWDDRGEQRYTNLAPGEYRFEVEADWLGAAAVLPYTVPVPWYRTPLAYVAFGLLLVLLGYLLFRLHHTRLREQARRLERIRLRQLEEQRVTARNRELERDVRRKTQELANTTLILAKKNEILLQLKEELAKLQERGAGGKPPQQLLNVIDRNLSNEEDWAIFESHFNEVHEEFLNRLRQAHPKLLSGDLRLAAYLRMDLPSKEIAPLLHISVRGVENKRYRLRKKLGLESNDNLNQYLQTLA